MRAVLCGYYGMGNGGDEALLASLLQMLPGGVTPIVLSGNPAETAQRYGVEAIPRKSVKAIWAALRRSQAFIWGGGSLMQDATSAINPWYYGGLMKLAQWMGLKTIAWAQGLGPLSRPTSRWLTRWVLQACEGVSVRDQGSADLLRQWGIAHCLAPDPVWALVSERLPALSQPSQPRVAVALRSHATLTSVRLTHLTQALVAFQVATQTEMVLLPFQPVKDLAIATHIAAQLPGPHQILVLEHPQQLKGIFEDIHMTIGMRFHALVMAAATGCRCFAISYDPKVTQLMQALHLPGWTLEVGPRPLAHPSPSAPLPLPEQPQSMTQQWLHHYTHGSSIAAHQIKTYREAALTHQTLLQKILQQD